jgi:hypothetical protein
MLPVETLFGPVVLIVTGRILSAMNLTCLLHQASSRLEAVKMTLLEEAV